MAASGTGPLIEAPASDSSTAYQTLAYLTAYDAVSDDDYAFVAYKETSLASGAWRVRVKSRETAGGVFEPTAMAQQARAAGAQGQPYFLWGYQFTPSAGDPRQIEFRVHVAHGEPERLELFVRLRRVDHSADDAHSISFKWPQD